MLKKIIDNFKMAHEREDVSTIHETVERGVTFKGTNLWILIFAIFIASIGLNVNSTATIIGAMLVSPLMGPIIGMGYSLATYDFVLFRRSLSNFTFASITALITSALYFLITPLNEAHSELLARTSPTIYDVLIALLGGLAGVIAITSRNKGNVIPGVAIATALMPPLCTAGYGLGTLQWDFFGGAIYLFTINVVFIGLATMLTTRLVKIPVLRQIDERHKKLANQSVMIIVLLTLIPSVYFGYLMVLKDHFLRTANQFIRNETYLEGDYLLKSDVDVRNKEINLVYAGKPIADADKKKVTDRIRKYPIKGVRVNITQAFSIRDLDKQSLFAEQQQPEIKRLQKELTLSLQQFDSLAMAHDDSHEILSELRIFYPQVISCSSSLAHTADSDSTVAILSSRIVIVNAKKGTLKEADQSKIRKWLDARYPGDTIELFIKEDQ